MSAVMNSNSNEFLQLCKYLRHPHDLSASIPVIFLPPYLPTNFDEVAEALYDAACKAEVEALVEGGFDKCGPDGADAESDYRRAVAWGRRRICLDTLIEFYPLPGRERDWEDFVDRNATAAYALYRESA
jgi:hypothetical protein